MYLIFGTIYSPSNVIVMQIVPQRLMAKQIVKELSNDNDLQEIHWHIHLVSYSQDAKLGVSNIKTKLRAMNVNRTSGSHKRNKALMPNAEKQMLNKFSAKKRQNNNNNKKWHY